MKNPAIRIKNIDGTEIHPDKRKTLIQALEKYSKKKIIKYSYLTQTCRSVTILIDSCTFFILLHILDNL